MIAYAKTVEEVVGVVVRQIIQPFVMVLLMLALFLFLWGVIEFLVISGDSEEKKTKGKQHMVWGLIGLAIMISVNGIVWVLINFVSSIID